MKFMQSLSELLTFTFIKTVDLYLFICVQVTKTFLTEIVIYRNVIVIKLRCWTHSTHSGVGY